ncbi:protein scabrous-like [Bombus pyrosoma]|uniref:protein scabrous-like n=1 Tax=Bombus pyrosoma TaxID=396416 RepID=UPI001CB982CC|nr:protein scabrous-like [Bombus pyrosoma]
MNRKDWLLCVTLVAIITRKEICGDENVSDAIRSLREQVNALLDHRQQDYNALEASLKRAIEKNTELFVLKNEIKQLRKEVISLRGGNGNEAKNERLRVRWLGSAVTELQGEVAQVLRTRNASEELAERSRMKGELSLLKGDVAAVGRGIGNLGGRIAKIEAILGTIRVDIAAMKERFSLLFRTCADIASQLNSMQIEVKSLRCESFSANVANSVAQRNGGGSGKEEAERKMRTTAAAVPSYFSGMGTRDSDRETTAAASYSVRSSRRRFARKHGYWKRKEEGHRTRLDDRLKSLERKILLSARRRASLEKRIATYENQEWTSLSKRIKSLEKGHVELSRKISNVTENGFFTKKVNESLGSRLIDSLRTLEDAMETNNSFARRELTRLDVNAARKAAELSLTREELSNLRRTVQALSVSASKLQERSDKQQEAIDRLNGIHSTTDFQRYLSNIASDTITTSTTTTTTTISSSSSSLSSDNSLFSSFEHLEDRYHLIGKNLTGDCEQTTANEPMDGLRLSEAGKGGRPMLVFCRGGWMVIARRIDGTLDFDRNWNDYSVGFGSPVSEYWIGNEILHRLTDHGDNCTSLRIDMLDIYGERWRAEYQSFRVESEETGYRLDVYGYSGNATDALSYQNGMSFSAKDRDMDASTTHCARNYRGGWWFSRCQHANLNGKYSLGLTWFRSDTNRWMSIASSEMSLRRNSDCRSR